jgi:AAA+ superfamily predicted ATPase
MITVPFPPENWYGRNQQYLIGAIAKVRHAVQQLCSTDDDEELDELVSDGEDQFAADSRLETLCQIFALSDFERDILLLCAGLEWDKTWGPLCAAAQAQTQRPYPTFSLALAALSQPNWYALTPQAPLRRWQLIEMGGGNALTTSPLRIDERILHYLAGDEQVDHRLLDVLHPIALLHSLVPSQVELAESITTTWVQASQSTGVQGSRLLPVIQLCSPDTSSQQAIAASICQKLGLTLYRLSGEQLPTEQSQLKLLKLLLEREHRLSKLALLLDCNFVEQTDTARLGAIAQLIETIDLPLLLMTRDRRAQRYRSILSFEVERPLVEEQRHLWQMALGDLATEQQIGRLTAQFNFSPATIQLAALQLQTQQQDTTDKDGFDRGRSLWQICRLQARPRLDELAQRIHSRATWEDLILPARERQVLQAVITHVQQRQQVYEQWGFAAKSRRGLGTSALFAGASGTGKTTAAEILAHELQLDIYRIDLSSVVSKYIGETEKNLGRVFDAAEQGGVILLFDEADALFGKRSEVKDSRDRYANMEVGYLLQRMEAYQGLAILTTNLKNSLDQAFLRRIRFIVQFPFPDLRQRAEIWRRMFPSQTPIAGLDFTKLAMLNISGGNIRNIALNSAFIAAAAQEPIQMKHLLQAAKNEYLKLERPLTDAEIKGWI